MSAAGLAIPLLIVAAFFLAAKLLKAAGLRPEEQFVLPGERRGTTASS